MCADDRAPLTPFSFVREWHTSPRLLLRVLLSYSPLFTYSSVLYSTAHRYCKKHFQIQFFFVMARHCSCPGATKKFLISYPSPIPYCTALYDISLTNIILPQIIRLFHQSPDIFHLKLTHFICVQNVFLQIICKTKCLVAVCTFVQFRFTVS